MQGLMMNTPLTVTSIMQFADKIHQRSEIVSITHDQPLHRYSYGEAFARTRQLANALTEFGLSPGDRIATLAWNDYRHFELYYATSCSGYVCHTLNPRLFADQLQYIINHAEDRLIFVDPGLLPLLESVAEHLGRVKAIVVMSDENHMPASTLAPLLCYEALIAKYPPAFAWPAIDERQASAMCYTSGTTGNPKGVLYDHRSTVLHAYAAALPDAFNLSVRDTVLPIVPMFHANAWGIPYAAVAVGSKLIFPGPKMGDGETLARLINSEQVTLAAGVPTVWMALLDYLKRSGTRVDGLQRVLVGGAACPVSIMETFEQQYGVYAHAAWGMTETSPLGTYNAFIDKNTLSAEQYARQRVKQGKPVFGVELRIVDDDGRELPWDGVVFGRLQIRGPWIASDYYHLADNDAHQDGWFDTGDVATIAEDGTMQITDRSKDVIKSGGEWISSITLENLAVNHPAVSEAAVIGAAHPKWTERPLLVVVKAAGAKIDKKALLDWFEGQVASWWIPDDCLFVDELPHTATGKISKKTLREQLRDYQLPNL